MSKKSKKKKIIIIILLVFIAILLISLGGYLIFKKVYLDETKLNISLNGSKNITLKYKDKYNEKGAKASFRNENLNKNISIKGKVNTNKVGVYKIVYKISKFSLNKTIVRTVKVIDDVKPEIVLKGESEIKLTVGDEFVEPGYTATDNYDGDITSNVVVTNNIDNSKKGTYEVIYKVMDSSNNSYEIIRKVSYKPKAKALPPANSNATSIAVLNYHFFYEGKKGQKGGNYMSTEGFEEQLKYLKDNGYKTLTIKEFRQWMYGEINLPARSVLLTIDDGAAGTGLHNGNKLIPLLEKYQAHATLFLITGWWDRSNYSSSYLDIQSHSNDMHTEKECTGVSRGARMLCYNDEQVLTDLKTSLNIVDSNDSFAFPFYAYSNNSIELLKQVGFKLAFIGGDYKATRNTNKYKLPRYHMYDNTTLEQFINMIA